MMMPAWIDGKKRYDDEALERDLKRARDWFEKMMIRAKKYESDTEELRLKTPSGIPFCL